MFNKTLMKSAVISAVTLIGLSSVPAVAEPTGGVSLVTSVQEDEENLIRGYIKQANPYIFDDMERVETLRGLPSSSYITSDPDYSGGTPNIDPCLKADDQGGYGLCWVHSVNKAIEASLFRKGSKVNLSEKNTAYYYWNQLGGKADKSENHALLNAYNKIRVYPDDCKGEQWYFVGGNDLFLDGYLSAWKGIVKEEVSEDSIDITGVPNESSEENVFSSATGRVRAIYHAPADDKESIKALIKNYGAVACGMAADLKDTANNTHAWYTTLKEPNHQVAIIGWDNSYSRTNFQGRSGQPAHDGAWYCINSWGTNRDKYVDSNGGFWLSYDSAFLNDNYVVSAYDVVTPDETKWYNHNYIGGKAGSPASTVSDTNLDKLSDKSYGICYTANGNEQVEAIGFNTFEQDTVWTVKAYKGAYDDKTLMCEQVEDIGFPGFHTIELDDPFEVRYGENFYIEVKPTSPASVEYVEPGKRFRSLNLRSDAGTFSAYSHSGDKYGKSYVDGVEAEDRQVMIHAYTSDVTGGTPTETELTSKSGDFTVTYGADPMPVSSFIVFNPGYDGNGGYDRILTVTSIKPDIVTVDHENNLIFKDAGKSIITVTTKWGSHVSFDVTVDQVSIKGISVNGLKKSYICAYDKLPLKPRFTVTLNEKQLEKDKDYICTYIGNDRAGTASVTIKGAGGYKDNETRYFEIEIEEPDPEREPDKPEEDDPDQDDPKQDESEADEPRIITPSENRPMDYGTETAGDYEVYYAHSVPFPGNTKLGIEDFGDEFIVTKNGVSYRVTKIKVNKKKHLIQVTGLHGADKQTVSEIKKATKGKKGLPYVQNPYYVRNSNVVKYKKKKNGDLGSLKIAIFGSFYSVKKNEREYDRETGKITFKGDNLDGSYQIIA